MPKGVCNNPDVGKYLHAYELEVLGEAETELFEAHLLECDYCFSETRKFADEADLIRSDETVINDVSEKVGDIETSGQNSVWKKMLRRLWPDTPLVFKPAAALFLILLLVYPAYIGIISRMDSDIKPVSSISLMPSRAGDAVEYSLAGRNDIVLCFIVQDIVSGGRYILELTGEDGEMILYDDNFGGVDVYGVGRIFIPSGGIETGSYSLKLTIADEKAAQNMEIYNFRLIK